MMDKKLILAVDGGGTNSRFLLATSDGKIIDHFAMIGGTHPEKNEDPKKNIEIGIQSLLQHSPYEEKDIDITVAGLAGYNYESDRNWVEELFDFPWLRSSKILINDSIIAHQSVFMGKEGLLVFSGTGSNMLVKTKDGEYIRQLQLGHYTKCASRHLTQVLLSLYLEGRELNAKDQKLIRLLPQLFELHDNGPFPLEKLAKLPESRQRNQIFSQFAPFITEYARKGSVIAKEACSRIAREIVSGIRIFLPYLEQPFALSVVGSVGKDQLIYSQIDQYLKEEKIEYDLLPSDYPPVLGGVILGMQHLGTWSEENKARLLTQQLPSAL